MGMLVEAQPIDDSFYHSSTNSSVMVSLFGVDGVFISGNPPFQQAHGTRVKRISDIVVCEQQRDDFLAIIQHQGVIETDALLHGKRGQRWYRVHASCSQDSTGHPAILLHNYDIHERKVAELAINKQARTDQLTGLLNRFGLTELVKRRIKNHSGDNPFVFTLLYLDLDGFKLVNDSFGHAVGDLLLIEVADRLRKKAGEHTNVSRFGGDEFVLCVESLGTADNISLFCNDIQNELGKPFKCMPGQLQFISASIGCAIYPEDGLYFEQLISRADAAMYYAKNEGRKQHRIYLPEMELALKRASSISSRLMSAIQGNVLSLCYQPIMDVNQSRIDAFEALLRWNDDQLGPINPEEIIEIAEKTGLIQTLEHWVFQKAIGDLALLRASYGADLVMAVNMSGAHLAKKGAGYEISQLLNRLGATGADLRIELTESTFIESFEMPGNQINDLISCGVDFSIDDFGTGYSSLAYLHKIPAKTLKVDRTFVKDAKERPVILESILKMAQECSMVCVAEGIETPAESEFLKSLGFHLQQGFLFAKPEPLTRLVHAETKPVNLSTPSVKQHASRRH